MIRHAIRKRKAFPMGESVKVKWLASWSRRRNGQCRRGTGE
ncbi:hypothetical protein AB01_5137 [Escherichia coli 2-177-06_S1_C1]|nr:hypothetical protein SFK1770_2906 [Shigella flexneri K-1770]EZJ43812.1 hypothetical protein AD10_1686 [Escherichia coli 1-182-04_S4_C2]EZJ60410.1 hypothetical protein AC82_2725 [Escherichia coli 1-182-04_S4_C1]KDW12120.1 hypothetical protein AB01_5137 [Escherichia coli 2-177-06_S1_C1]KEJ64566.1 hypothetical protein AC85_5806 [Escherichia coli 3-020-07_S4_C1]